MKSEHVKMLYDATLEELVAIQRDATLPPLVRETAKHYRFARTYMASPSMLKSLLEPVAPKYRSNARFRLFFAGGLFGNRWCRALLWAEEKRLEPVALGLGDIC